MPSTDQLGEAVSGRLCASDQAQLPPTDSEGKRFRDGRFEEWLSYLAEDQPHLTEDKSLEARALLVRVTRTIEKVLSELQLEALGALCTDGSWWFYELLSVLHVSRATVITFNYDNLIECALEPYKRQDGFLVAYPWLGIDEEDILNGRPRRADLLRLREIDSRVSRAAIGPGPGVVRVTSGADTFRLLKLHGSLSWYSAPEDPTGSTLQRWTLPGVVTSPQDDDGEDRRRVLPGGEPFIVPPAALKSQHLRNPVVRELWREASAALKSARRVVLVGYSLPPADRSFGGIVSEALVGGDVAIEVVDREPVRVVERLKRLGVPKGVIKDPCSGDDCVQLWVERERDILATGVVKGLRGLGGEELLLAGNRAVTAVTATGSSGDAVLQVTADQNLSSSLPSKELLPHLATARRLVTDEGGRKQPVVGYELCNRSAVGVHGHVTLIPAGRP